MSDLESTIRKLADKGQLNHLTLIYKGDGKRSHIFSAGYRDATSAGYAMVEDADPVKALMAALTAPRSKPAAKPTPKRARDLI